MKRNIISINEDLCNGCGICVSACHEGALQLVDGKAKLISDSYCDGLGACLPECPTGAITVEEREAAAFDEEAVKAREAANKAQNYDHGHHSHNHGDAGQKVACGCPSTHAKTFNRRPMASPSSATSAASAEPLQSELRQWPCQIQLVSANAPFFDGADLLIAADCTAYAYPGFHSRFMKDKVTLIGCPKLDDADYAEKLAAILAGNDIRSITVVRMQVPCCGDIVNAVKEAIRASGVIVPWQVITISTDGDILN